MSLPKFTAEASLENYGNAYVNRKYKNDNSSIKIEPAMRPRPTGIDGMECDLVNCRTQRCKQICGLGPPIEWCEGTRTVCDTICHNWEFSYPGPTYYDDCSA